MEIKKEKSLVKKEKKLTKEAIFLISLIVLIVLLDQGTKIWMHHVEEINLISGVLNLKVSQNTNPAYGIGSNSTIMYVATNVVILGVIFKFITTQNQFVDKKFKVFLSFILAGGISNTMERILRGYVTGFIDFRHNLPIFNVADFFVVIGWIAIAAIFAVFTVKEWRSKKTQNQLDDKDKNQKS